MAKMIFATCLTVSLMLSLASADSKDVHFSSELNLTVFARNGDGPPKVRGTTPSKKIVIPNNYEWGISLKKEVDSKKLYTECIEKGVYNIDFHFAFPANYLNGIEKVEGLKILTFSGTGITDEDLALIANLKNLEYLAINGFNKISSDGFGHILKLKKLERLDLASVRLTDADVLSLQGYTSLKLLIIDKKRYSEESVNKLKQSLPKCTIR